VCKIGYKFFAVDGVIRKLSTNAFYILKSFSNWRCRLLAMIGFLSCPLKNLLHSVQNWLLIVPPKNLLHSVQNWFLIMPPQKNYYTQCAPSKIYYTQCKRHSLIILLNLEDL